MINQTVPIKSFIFYSDPGHGWVEVPRSMLIALKILDKITPYSYQRNNMAYLEEDNDAMTFFEAYKAKYGIEPKFDYKFNEGSAIRGYNRFSK